MSQKSSQHLAKGTPGSCLGIASCCVSDFSMAINEGTNFFSQTSILAKDVVLFSFTLAAGQVFIRLLN